MSCGSVRPFQIDSVGAIACVPSQVDAVLDSFTYLWFPGKKNLPATLQLGVLEIRLCDVAIP